MAKHLVKISVVVTVLNESATVGGLLNALNHQTLSPAEVIIVDGGSRDDTVQVLETYQHKYPKLNVKIVQQKGNRSLGRNVGIQVATYPLIAITDAGCIPHLNWLAEFAKQVAELPSSTKTFVLAGYYDAKPKTAFEAAVVPYVLVMPDQVNPDDFLPATRSMLLTKTTWEKVAGFNESLSDNEDYAFAHALRQAQIPIIFVRTAKVLWQPRSSLLQFAWMIFRFARGDIYAGIVRPKVLFLFARYVVALVAFIFIAQFSWLLAVIFAGVGLSTYCSWAIFKNYRYVPQGWFWLPVLQLTADLFVMFGSLVGLVRRILAPPLPG